MENKIKFAKDIIREIKQRGPVKVKRGYVIGENFEKYLRRNNEKVTYEKEK